MTPPRTIRIPVVVNTALTPKQAEDVAAALNLALEAAGDETMSILALLTVTSIRLAKEIGVSPEQWAFIVGSESLRIFGRSPETLPPNLAPGHAVRVIPGARIPRRRR